MQGVLVGIVIVAFAATAAAQSLESMAPEIHGFASQGFLWSTDNNYLARTKRGSFEFTEVGLNFTAQLGEQLRVGFQLFSRELGPLGDYTVRADWFYLDYRWRDWLGLRAGRVKIPFGLYNDINDIDAARVFALLPQGVYPAQNREMLLAQNGFELYGYRALAELGALDYRLYLGTIYVPTAEQSTPRSFEIRDLGAPYVVGGRMVWETPLPGLDLAFTIQKLRLDADLGFAPATVVKVKLPAFLWVASAEYAPGKLVLAAEFSRWHVQTRSSDVQFYPESNTTSERFYASATYRFAAWFWPGVYHSAYYRDVERRETRGQYQFDSAVTLRFDVNAHWLVKLEAHYMNGTAGVRSSLNGNKAAATLPKSWGLVAIKTTAYF